MCRSVCSGYNFWTAKAWNFIFNIQISWPHFLSIKVIGLRSRSNYFVIFYLILNFIFVFHSSTFLDFWKRTSKRSRKSIIRSQKHYRETHLLTLRIGMENGQTVYNNNCETLAPWVKSRKYVWFWGDQKIHSTFYNGCLWENSFWSLKK